LQATVQRPRRPGEVVGGALGIDHHGSAREARCDLLEHPQPFACDARLNLQETCEITARPGQARDETGADRVGCLDEHDRDRPAFPLQGRDDRGCMRKHQIGLQVDQLFGGRSRLLWDAVER
jgi:hypothetical protein